MTIDDRDYMREDPSPQERTRRGSCAGFEWELEDVNVEGSTVTVMLRVFAGVDVDVTLDGKSPDQTGDASRVLEYVFLDVSPGTHEVKVSDVVGFEQLVVVTVPAN